MDALLNRLRQRAVWSFSCQPRDGAPACLDERCPERGNENQADQPDGNPAGLEAPGCDCHVEPGDKNEQHADPEEGTYPTGEIGERTYLLDPLHSPEGREAEQPGANTDKVADGSAYMQEQNDSIGTHDFSFSLFITRPSMNLTAR